MAPGPLHPLAARRLLSAARAGRQTHTHTPRGRRGHAVQRGQGEAGGASLLLPTQRVSIAFCRVIVIVEKVGWCDSVV